MDYALYEDKAKYDWWFKIILTLPVVIIVVTGVFAVRNDPDSLIVLMATAIFIILFIYIIMPRKFYVMREKLKVVLGAGVSFCIPYSKIKMVRKMKGASIGINFVTSVRTPVEIVMNGGININFSPENREMFIDNINKTIERWRVNRLQ